MRLLGWLGLYLVMPSGGHKKDDLALVEDRGDDGDVRQVAAARQLGVVADQHVALLNAFIFSRAHCVIPQLHEHSHVLTLEELPARFCLQRSARTLCVLPPPVLPPVLCMIVDMY